MKRKRPGAVLLGMGSALIAAALLLAAWNLFDDWRAGAATESAARQLLEAAASSPAQEKSPAQNGGPEGATPPDYILEPDMEMPVMEIGGRDYIGVLEIPSLGLELPVLSEWNYPNLREAPCRYAGSAYKSGFVVAGHSYRSHFGSLGNLAPGAEVFFTDAEGNRLSYAAALTETISPSGVEEMLDESWDLTLFTCDYSGRARVAVRCVKNDPLSGGRTGGTENET